MIFAHHSLPSWDWWIWEWKKFSWSSAFLFENNSGPHWSSGFFIKDLISVSYNNGISVESEPFYFEDEVHSILKLFKNLDQSFKVTVNISQETDFVTDPVRMRTILRNLLSNSFNYYSPDVAEPSIDLTSGPAHLIVQYSWRTMVSESILS